MEAFEVEGLWWPESRESEREAGKLIFDPENGATLTLSGFEGIWPNLDKAKQIFGITYDAIKFTLHDCLKLSTGTVKYSNDAPAMQKEIKYHAEVIYKKAHIAEEPTFESVTLSYDYLDEWVGISGFKSLPTFSLKAGEYIKIEYEILDDILLTSTKLFDVYIQFRHTTPGLNTTVQKEKRIAQQIVLKLVSKKGQHPFKDFREIIEGFMHFLCISIKKPVTPIFVTGLSKNYESEHPYASLVNKGTFKDKIGIHMYYPVLSASTSVKPAQFIDFNFRYKDIKSNTDKICNWFNIYEDLKPVYNLYFSSIYKSDIYYEHIFLSTVQAVELFHRLRRTSTIISKSSFREMKKDILNSIDNPEHKSWLDERFIFSNEPRLKERIEDITNELEPIFIIQNKKHFITKIVETRHYLTHYDKDQKKKASHSIDEMQWLIEQTRMMLEITFLKECGFPNDLLTGIVNNSRIYQRTLKQAEDYL